MVSLLHAYNLTRVINSASVCLDALTDFMLLDPALLVLESSPTTVISNNAALVWNLMDAASGRVAAGLFPVEDLVLTLAMEHS